MLRTTFKMIKIVSCIGAVPLTLAILVITSASIGIDTVLQIRAMMSLVVIAQTIYDHT